MAKTYYEILGVPRNAGEREIKAAYHRLARSLHPDKAASPEERQRMENEFALISQAYNVLKDKEKRAQYDKTLEIRQQQFVKNGSAEPSPGPGIESSGVQPIVGRGAALEKNRAAVGRRAYLRGLQAFSTGDYAKAADFFEVAIKNNNEEANYHAKLAQTLLRAQRGFSRAIEAIQRAIELDPYNTDYRLILAELYEQTGVKSLAQKTYEEILKWDPTNPRALAAVASNRPLTFSEKLMRAIKSFLGRS